MSDGDDNFSDDGVRFRNMNYHDNHQKQQSDERGLDDKPIPIQNSEPGHPQ
ncbi:MAG: hypothetical protein OXL36_16480 [Bryobacterales bacterium]|nr:hypothetical protein [Bryobacterales bacterium]